MWSRSEHGARLRRPVRLDVLFPALLAVGLAIGSPAAPADESAWLLDIRRPAPDAAEPESAQSPEPTPPWLELRRLRARVDKLAWSEQQPRDVLVVQVDTADGADVFPDGWQLTVHMAPVSAMNEAPDAKRLELVARAEVRSPRLARRTGHRVAGSDTGVAVRFSGLPELGDLSSTVLGRSVTFRAPLHHLRRLFDTDEAGETPGPEQGPREVMVWATTRRGDLADDLPAVRRDGLGAAARLRLPGPGQDLPGL